MSIELWRLAERAWLDSMTELKMAQIMVNAAEERRREAQKNLEREAARLTDDERKQLKRELFRDQ